MCAHSQYGAARCPGLNVEQPWLELLNGMLFLHVVDSKVQRASGKEALMRTVVFLQSQKTHTEMKRSS